MAFEFDANSAKPEGEFDPTTATPAPPSGAFRRGVTDKVLGVASGALGLTKAVADAAGADNVVSRTLDKGVKGIDSALSPEAQADRQEQSAIMDEAKGKGVWDQVKAGANAFAVAPVQTTAQGVGSAIPFIAASVAGAPAAIATGVAAGVGTIKSAIFDDVKKRSTDAGMSEADATAAATRAQEYSGQNQDQIALGGALGVADAMTGVSRIGGALLRNAVGKPVAAAAKQGVPRGIMARSALGAAEEMPLEAAQGGQEQYAANVASNRAGFNVDPMEGVASNATLEALASAGPGAGLGALHTGGHAAQPIDGVIPNQGQPLPMTAPRPAAPPAQPPAPAGVAPFPTLDAIDPNANATAPTPGFDPATAMLAPVAPAAVPLPTIDPTMGPISTAASLLADAAGVVSAPDPAKVAKAEADAKAKGKGKGKTEVKPKPVPPTPVAQTAPKQPDAAPGAPAGPLTTAATFAAPTSTPSTTGGTSNAPTAKAIEVSPQPAQQGPIAQADAGANQDVRGTEVAPGPIGTAAPVDGATTPTGAGGVNVKAQFQTDQGAGTGQAASPGTGTEASAETGTGAVAQTDQPAAAPPVAPATEAGQPAAQVDVFDASTATPLPVVDDGAHDAATSPMNDRPEPSWAQKEGGNAKLGHTVISGLSLSIENPEGSTRKSKPDSPVKWETTMKDGHYGYVKGSIGMDGDHVDTFIKPGTPLDFSGTVFVVDQIDPATGKPDEHKVMIGYPNELAARSAYQGNYQAGWKGFKAITPMAWDEFKAWVKSEGARLPAAPVVQGPGAQPPAGSPAATGSTSSADAPAAPALAPSQAAAPSTTESVSPAAAGPSPDGTPDPAAGKWYGTKEKADAKLASLGLTDTHEVVRDGMRFELRKKAAAAPANPLQQKVAEAKAKKDAPAAPAIVKGEIGMKFEAGQIVTTSSGRQTTPFPKVDTTTNGKTNNTLKRVDAWLISNALAEAQSRGDTFNERQFQAVNNLNPTQSDKDSAEEYLFGEQPKVVPSILKPLVTPPKKPVTPQIPNDPAVTYGLPTFASNGTAKGIAATWDSLSPEWRRTKLADAGYTDADQARVLSGTPWNGLTESVRKALDKNWDRKPPEPAAAPAPAPAPVVVPEPKAKPVASANTIFTEDAAAAARTRLKAKLGRLNSGIDPETMLDGITLAGYHIEKGARTFAAYAKAMLEDLGDGVKPYLKSWYMGVRYDPRASGFDGMSPAAEVDAADLDALETPAEKADTAPDQPQETLLGANNDTGRNATDDRQLLDDAVPQPGNEDGQGGDPATINGLRTPDPAADGRPEDDRSGRGDGLDGNPQPVLPGTPAEVRPLADSPVGRTEERPDALTGENPGNFEITYDLRLGEGTDGQKIKANLDAIRTLRLVQKERRFPTNEEQRVMARYVGWGGLKTVFDSNKKDATDLYGKAQRELRELLNPQEYRAANGSIRNAHYTAQGIVQGMWRVARHMGFKGGRVLEPTVGIGNFIGLQPKDMAASSQWHASELDTVTGQMAAMLYPEANVLASTGFQDAPFADDAFDLVIGNPPFGQQTIDDKNPNRKHLSGMKIHNYIIAKSGMHLRPGGVMSLVVTHRFLDTANPEARDVLAADFKFLGAFRLPNNAFAENAGTEVVTDVIFLQKLRPDEARDREASWLDVNGKITVDGQDIRVNRYYQDNPSHILGRSATDGTMYGGRTPEEGGQGEYTVHGDGRDLGQAIDNLITGGFADLAGIMERTGSDMSAAPAMLMQSDLPVGGVMLDADDKIRRRELDDDRGNAVIVEITPETLWKEQAAEWQALQTSLLDIRERAKDGRVNAADAQEFLALASFTFKSDGTKRAEPSKAEAAVYKLVDALAKPESFKWDFDNEGLQIGLALARKQLGEKGYKSLKGMLDLRNRALRLIRAEQTEDPKMEDLRQDLNTAYDAFVKANGFLSDPKNSNLLDGDIGVEAGLEATFDAAISAEVSKSTGIPARKASATKADILKQRVNFPYKEITTAATSADALSVSLSEHGKVDLPYMARITGKSILEVINDLSTGENPQLFRDPETNEFQEAERYLSGNVRHKLEVAREKNERANIKALEKVQPEPKTKSNVTPNIRGMWVPEAIFSEFLQSIGYRTPRISILASQGIMTAEGGPIAITDFGTQFRHARATPVDMFNAAVAGKPLIIYDPHPDGRVRNDAMTKEVTALVDRMAKVFQEWAYSDDRRADAVVAAFNEKMNTHVKRTYDGVKYLRQVGASPSIKLRRTQKNAAWRMIQEKTMLADHVVGAGKTFTLITGIMERRRMGLSRKPMVAVPNHLVVQWARDFYKLYPSAKVLAATPADFARKNRRRLLARIATGDYDAIIIGHSSLGFIETPAEDLRAIVDEKLAGLRETMEVARANKESKRTLGQIEDRIEKYEARLAELAERPTDEIGIDFKSMGIDHLSVDEAHEFKNLEYSTSGDRVKGMNDPNGSKKAFDLYSKARGLLGRDGGVVFATGTPVSNSLVEIYTVMSYLAHDQLVLRNQDHFDSWSGAYAATETRLEYTSTQKLKPARVLAGLNNLSALRQLYEQFADIITMADLKRIYTEEKIEENKRNGTNLSTEFPIPRVRYGARQLNSGPVTKAQQEYMDYLVARMTVIEQRKSDRAYPAIDNPLNVLTDARKMSLDIRIVDPTAPRDENGKVMRAAKNIKAAYDASDANRGTQLVFCDLSTPAKTAAKEAKRMVTEALTLLVGEKKVKANRSRFDGLSFEKQWSLLRESAERIIDDPATDEQRRDQVSTYFDAIEDAEATMLTADIGFSVYDDMRKVLTEMGIPESEIAFIHDYNTPEQKEKLFDRVNNGYIRVLMGSTMKMGAGTNAQRRVVALHHMDAPWRPSDVEQREGRVIRQGNLFATLPELIQGGVNELYDPEFEVGIDAYSTENTSDTVMWQVLERKAGAIEQFRAGGLDSTVEEGSDSNQYAEFMASSTGNPVFRLKLEAERKVTELTADISGALITQSNAAAFMQQYESRRASNVAMRDAAQAASGFTSASYGGQSGTVAEFEVAMKDAEAKYMERFAEFQTRRSEAEIAIAAWELQPEASRGDKPKTPTAPSRPNLMTNTVQTNSGFARAIAMALKEAKVDKQVTITLSDSAKIVIDGSVVTWKKVDENAWSATLRMGDQTIKLAYGSGDKASDSVNMVQGLTPSSIAQDIERATRNASEQIADLDSRKAENQRRAKMDIDTSKRDAATAELRWYERQVRFAEIESDIRRSSRPNRYIARDRRRPLGQMARVELAEVQTVEVDGEKFTTTGVQDGSGSYMNMQATRDSDGLPAVVRIRTVASGKNETETSVVLQPASIPFKPRPGKSTNLRQTGAPEGNDTDVVFNTRDDAPFYSALSREVGAIPAKAQAGVGWAMNIAGLVKAGKVKQDEVNWTGVLDWLRLQEGKVTKEQVAQYLDANGVRVEETVLGGGNKPPGYDADLELLSDNGLTLERNPEDPSMVAFMDENGDLLSADELAEEPGLAKELVLAAYRVQEAADADKVPTRYANYQLPGGSNYREVLLTLPAKTSADPARAEYEAWAQRNGLQPNATFAEERYKRETGKDAPPPRSMTAMQADAAQNFKSSHWDQPNVLAHIRVNDRVDVDGKKVLFVEEIQSDYGQAVKKAGGFDVKSTRYSVRDANGNMRGDFATKQEAQDYLDKPPEHMRHLFDYTARVVDVPVQSVLPRAPFVGTTDAWLRLALKRIVKMAADGGYDRVAFVNGDQSAERYDLSKQIDRIHYEKADDGTYELVAYKLGSRDDSTGSEALHEDEISLARVEELVGKEIAQKIADEAGENIGGPYRNWRELKGVDLQVGGEGMKAFYDKIVPNTLKDVLRKVGGGALETVTVVRESVYPREFPGEAKATEWAEANLGDHDYTVRGQGEGTFIVYDEFTHKEVRGLVGGAQPGFTITPAMREKAAGGLPMFARQGYTGANAQSAGTPDSRPDAARNIGVLERAIGGGADTVHPYVGRIVPGAELLGRVAGAFGESFQGFGLRAGLTPEQLRTFGFFNGAYLKGTIYLLDKGNDRPHLAILGHEMAHRMAITRPDLYAKLVAAIEPYINSRYDAEFVNLPVARKAGTAAKVKEEFIGEVLSDGFMDKTFWRAVGSKNSSLLAQVRDFIGDLIDQIKAKLGYNIRTARFLRDYDRVMQIAGEVMAEYGTQPPSGGPGGGIAFDRRGGQSDTAAFKAWFKGSKVVNPDGSPMVMYHGTTRANFTVFDRMKSTEWRRPSMDTVGSWFSDNPSEDGGAGMYSAGGESAIYPVYLSIQNPKRYRTFNDFLRHMHRAAGRKMEDQPAPGRGSTEELRAELKADGFDGIEFEQTANESLMQDVKDMMDAVERAKKEEFSVRRAERMPYTMKRGRLEQTLKSMRKELDEFGSSTELDKQHIFIAFEPEQIKSAIGNSGAFDPANADIRFNRIDTAQTLSRVTEALKQATSPIGTVSLWDKTVGTQYHKATKDADFKRVFDGYVQQTDDTAHYAIESERLAPSILMRLESVGDVAKAMRNFDPRYAAKQKADLVAVSKALFANIEGETGVKQVKYDERSLREIFNLTPKQIEMYYQARAAVDQSIERLAQTFAAQMGRDQGLDIERVKNYDLDDTVAIVKAHIQEVHDEARAVYENARQLLSEITPEDEMADETAAELAKQMRRVPKGPSKAETERQLEQLDKMVEHARFLQENAYMPAMRFGEYAVTVADKEDGEILHFEMFESKMAANLAAIRLGKEYPGARVDKSVMNPQQYAMFKGVSPETVELFAKFTGMDQNEAYRDYIALAKSARSVKVRELQRKGIAGFSEDATRVMASFLTSNARQAAMNVNIGEITDALASKSLARKGDVQREAQKLHEYMANPLEEARRMRGFLFMHFIGGSIASALVNMTQPVLQTAPYLHQFAKAKTARIMASAAKIAATGKIEDKDLRAAAKRAAEDGITEPHEIHQLMADASGSSFGGGLAARAAVKAWGGFFSLAEAYNRRLTFIAAYQTAQETGEADPYEFARKAVIETQGLYAKANRPNWARGPVGATLFTFKQFSISYIEFINRMPRRQKLIALAVLLLVAGAQGLPFADDVEDLIDTIGQSLGYNTNSKKLLRQVLVDAFGQTMGEILNTGVFSQTGIDVHGRLGMGNLIPGTALFLPSETDKSRTLSEIAGPLGGILMAAQKALGAAQRGDFVAAGREMAPVAVKNFLQGADMAKTGVYKDSRGYKVTDVDALDSFFKMLGLQPGTVAKETRKISDAFQDKSMVTMMEGMIADRWAAGVAEKDPDQVAKARATLHAWNDNNPDFRIVIKPAQIMARVKKINQTRAERFIKTAPREVRATIARELQ